MQYPYTASPDPTMDGLLTRPRFSTRRHDALFLRVEAVYADNVQIQSFRSPVGIFADALKSESGSDSGTHFYLWEQVKAAAISDSDDRSLPTILSDDTINLLSLISTDPKEQVLLGTFGAASTLVTPLSPVTEAPLSTTRNGNGVSVPIRQPEIPCDTPQPPKDWAEFSSAGFGEITISKNFASTLLDKDVEVTEPPVQRNSNKRKQIRSTVSAKTSAEFSSPAPQPDATPELGTPKFFLAATEIVQLDEAFVDFWRDAVMDPVSDDWPKFVVGELKHSLTPHPTSTSFESEASPVGPINWIIIEERLRRPTPPPTPIIPHEASSGGLKVGPTLLKKAPPPRPSFGDKKGSLSATFKRFTLFGSSRDDLMEDVDSTADGSGKKDSLSGRRKKGGVSKSPDIGEVDEVLSEEPEPLPQVSKKADEPETVERTEETGEGKDKVVAVAAGVVGGAAVGAVLATASGSEEGKAEVVEDVPSKEETEEATKTSTTTEDDELPTPPPVTPTIVEEHSRGPVPATVEEVIQETIIDEPTGPTSAELNIPTPGTPVVVTEVLPPAPESIVSHGETPGPQLALDSSEVGLHHLPDPAIRVGDVPTVCDTETADVDTRLLQPTIEHLEDKVEDPAADAGVDLDPVPIIPNDPVEPVEAEPEVPKL